MSVKRQKRGMNRVNILGMHIGCLTKNKGERGRANESLHYDVTLWGLETGGDTSICPLRKKGFPKVTLKFRRKGSTDFKLNIIYAQYDYIHSYTIG